MAITHAKIAEVEVEIERLQVAFSEYKTRRLKTRCDYEEWLKRHPNETPRVDSEGFPYYDTYPLETGAIRHASMDLTRALSRLRSSKD